MRTDISPTYRYSGSLVDVYKMISDTGWSVKKVKFDKKADKYAAEATNEHGESITKTGPDEHMAVRNLYLAITRKNNKRASAFEMLSVWQYHWNDKLKPIAEAYAKAPVYDPRAATAFKVLADDNKRRAEVLREQLGVEETFEPHPYPNIQSMVDDVTKRRKYKLSLANAIHPVWTPDQVGDYRLVHDVLGHAVGGGDWGWEGENLATAAHMPIVSSEAQKALFSEAVAKRAYEHHYRSYGPQKVALFPQFHEPAQAQEGVSEGYPGQHPSQTMPPVAVPAIPAVLSATDMLRRVQAGEIDPTLQDPNQDWKSGIPPQEPNAYLDHGDPLEAQAVSDNARLIDTEWASLPDKQRQKEAIENAFRVVLLSPQKDLRWNTIHYQDLQGVHSQDPVDYWNTLEKKRQDWNVKNFGEDARFSHRPYFKLLPEFENIIFQKYPQLGWKGAQEKAKREFLDLETEVQEKVLAEDADLPEEKRRNQYEVENEANKRLKLLLKEIIEEQNPQMDMLAASQPDTEELPISLDPQPRQVKLDRYGAFMGTHLKAIAQVSQHADEILKAALEDVHEHDGAGHHFRAAVMQLGVPGIGPKTASFAWLLLQPMTSQLATIDTHMMDVLGKDYDSEMNNRDYFKFERELQAGRDAAGYEHVPLGQFQWGMWDLKRTGPGTHQDHSGLRVLDPQDHDSIDWHDKESPLRGDAWSEPDWWAATQPMRNEVGEEWDERQAKEQPKNKVPYVSLASFKVAATLRSPWFIHPFSGERMQGQPGQTLMSHLTQTMGLSTPEIWQMIDEPNVGKA